MQLLLLEDDPAVVELLELSLGARGVNVMQDNAISRLCEDLRNADAHLPRLALRGVARRHVTHLVPEHAGQLRFGVGEREQAA